jgi:hypothetical protein
MVSDPPFYDLVELLEFLEDFEEPGRTQYYEGPRRTNSRNAKPITKTSNMTKEEEKILCGTGDCRNLLMRILIREYHSDSDPGSIQGFQTNSRFKIQDSIENNN